MIYAGLTVNGIKMASLQPLCAGYQRLRTIPVAMNGAGVLPKINAPKAETNRGVFTVDFCHLVPIPSNASTRGQFLNGS
jgi:hypothetical protein